MTERIANAVCSCMPCTERDLRFVEAYGKSNPGLLGSRTFIMIGRHHDGDH
jgi:hypothetical protein